MTGPSFAERFSSFEGHAYLAAASQGPLPAASARAGKEALRLKEQPWRLGPGTHQAAIARRGRWRPGFSARARSRWRS